MHSGHRTPAARLVMLSFEASWEKEEVLQRSSYACRVLQVEKTKLYSLNEVIKLGQ